MEGIFKIREQGFEFRIIMKANDYISRVLKPLNNKIRRKMIEAELSDHILTNQNFYEEIGYPEDNAQEKAVECMGDSESVADQFAHMYNKNNKIGKRILFAGILFILCYVLSLSSINAPEVFYLFTGIVFISFMLIFYVFSFFAVKKKDIWYSIITLLFLAICTYPIGFDFMESAAHYLNLPYRAFVWDDFNNITAYPFLIALFSPVLINCIFVMIYNIRAKRLKNGRKDLKYKKILEWITGIVAAILLILSITGIFKFVVALDEAKEQRYADYQYACEMSEKIQNEYNNTDKTIEDILKELDIECESSTYNFYLLKANENSCVYWYVSVETGLSSTINEGHKIHISIDATNYSLSFILQKRLTDPKEKEYELIEPLERTISK